MERLNDQAFDVGSPELGDVLARPATIRPLLVVGMIERSGPRYYNTVLVLKGGRVLGGYRKTFRTAAESEFTAGDAYRCSTVAVRGSGSTSASTPTSRPRFAQVPAGEAGIAIAEIHPS